MSDHKDSKLSERINRLRWLAPVLAFLLVLTHQILEHTWLVVLPRWSHFTTQLFFYGLLGPPLVWWVLTLLWRRAKETESAQQALETTHLELTEANQRLEFLIRVNRRLAEAEDEEALIEVMLDLPQEVVPAVGCSVIRFDERGQPLPAVHRGQLEPAMLEAWSTSLSADKMRHECKHCSTHHATEVSLCPLLESLPAPLGGHEVYCLTLMRGGREYGVLNIYLSEADQLDSHSQTLLGAMATEMSLALESWHLRSRELATLYRLQQARRLSNLHSELADVLLHTAEALEVDGAVLFLTNSETAELDLVAEAGRSLGSTFSLVQGLVNGAQHTETPLIISDLQQEGNNDEQPLSLLIAPLRIEGQSLGSLILWAVTSDIFTRRRTQLVATVAGQMALLVENHRLYSQAEHQVTLAERARLAREIHDGLAQTIGYLKLRTAQIASWLATGATQQASTGLDEVRGLLGEAYVDAREAIDGLRLKPGEERLDQWLEQSLLEFQELSAIHVEAGPPPNLPLPPEVQIQLLRIVQEALSNIRKHSQATCVQVEWQVNEHWLTLRISDNGHGFDPDDVPPISRHGLRIMCERAELLDAGFQIVSRPGEGTQVVIRLPLGQAHQVGNDG